MIEKLNADFKENVTISIESKVFAKDKTKWPPNHYWSALIVRQSLLIFAPAFFKNKRSCQFLTTKSSIELISFRKIQDFGFINN
jgi:hypothetical protein